MLNNIKCIVIIINFVVDIYIVWLYAFVCSNVRNLSTKIIKCYKICKFISQNTNISICDLHNDVLRFIIIVIYNLWLYFLSDWKLSVKVYLNWYSFNIHSLRYTLFILYNEGRSQYLKKYFLLFDSKRYFFYLCVCFIIAMPDMYILCHL